MTFNEWLQDLLDPAHLLTEGIYNIVFEVIATIVFVRISLGKLVKKELKKYEEENNKTDGTR